MSRVTKCQHSLHAQCMHNLINNNSINCLQVKGARCPLCRHRFSERDISQFIMPPSARPRQQNEPQQDARSKSRGGYRLCSACMPDVRLNSSVRDVTASSNGFATVLTASGVSSLFVDSTGAMRCEPRHLSSKFDDATCVTWTQCGYNGDAGYVVACERGLLHFVCGAPYHIAHRRSNTSNITHMSSENDVIAAFDARTCDVIVFHARNDGELLRKEKNPIKCEHCDVIVHKRKIYVLSADVISVYTLAGKSTLRKCLRGRVSDNCNKLTSSRKLVKFKNHIALLQTSPPTLHIISDDVSSCLPVQIDNLEPTETLHDVMDFNQGVMLVFRRNDGGLRCKQFYLTDDN